MDWGEMHEKYGKYVLEASTEFNLDPAFLMALIKAESNGDPKAKSHRGAFGLTQIMPGTAMDRGYKLETPRDQIFSGADYLAWIREYFTGNNEEKMAAGYNAGVGRLKADKWKRFEETRKYIAKIKIFKDEYKNYLNILSQAENNKVKVSVEKVAETTLFQKIINWFRG